MSPTQKFLIAWDAGFGNSVEAVDAADLDDATEMAEAHCMEEVQSNITFEAFPYSREKADELGMVFDDDEED